MQINRKLTFLLFLAVATVPMGCSASGAHLTPAWPIATGPASAITTKWFFSRDREWCFAKGMVAANCEKDHPEYVVQGPWAEYANGYPEDCLIAEHGNIEQSESYIGKEAAAGWRAFISEFAPQ